MDRNNNFYRTFVRLPGQARKSLWIETEALTKYLKDGEKVRLVRACGSKQSDTGTPLYRLGQARKSLWIETQHSLQVFPAHFGQARKSLWIETIFFYNLYPIQAWSGS